MLLQRKVIVKSNPQVLSVLKVYIVFNSIKHLQLTRTYQISETGLNSAVSSMAY